MADRSAASNFGVINVCAGDVPEEFREGAAFEVRALLAAFDEVAWSFEPVHLDVVLAADLAERIARVEKGYHWISRRGSVYGTVGVRGVTLYADRRSPLRSTIVLDGGYWTKDDTESRVLRCYLLFHEFRHVVQAAEMSDEEWAASRQSVTSVWDSLLREANYLWCEHDADVFSDHMIRGLTQGTGGPGNFLVDGFATNVRTLLEELAAPDLLAKDGDEVRAQGATTELFRVLAHLSALWRPMGDEQHLTKVLSELPGFERVLGHDWLRFHAALALPYAADAEAEIADVLRASFRQIGFQV